MAGHTKHSESTYDVSSDPHTYSRSLPQTNNKSSPLSTLLAKSFMKSCLLWLIAEIGYSVLYEFKSTGQGYCFR